MPSDRVMGLLAAGGASARFGSPKAVHPVDGRPMAASVYGALSAVILDVRVGLAYPGDPSPLPGVPVLFDDPPGAGPIGSLRAALRCGSADWVVIAACDMPGVEAAHVRALLDARTDDVVATVAVDAEKAVHPLLACYSREVLAATEDLLREGRRSMRALVERIEHVTLPMPARALWNVNRPEDLLAPPNGP